MKNATFVIIGGGIAGVSCSQGLNILSPEDSCILITSSPTIKAVTNIVPIGKMVTQFDVEEQTVESWQRSLPALEILEDSVTGIDPQQRIVFTSRGESVHFERLCICSGAKPKTVECGGNPFVLGLRDSDSVKDFEKKISSARKVLILGNGGIATELVHALKNVEIVWAIRDKHISATFIDPGAAEFYQSKLNSPSSDTHEPMKRTQFTIHKGQVTKGSGPALGPDWHEKVSLSGLLSRSSLLVEYCCEFERILEKDELCKSMAEWPVMVKLTNGKVHGCDFVVSATGVSPNTDFIVHPVTKTPLEGLRIAKDGGIEVNWKMETSVEGIYAAGDVCSAAWEEAQQWFQMRLWTQARHMGSYASRAMVASVKGEELIQDFSFELFTHATKFFGMKVILLGLFNGQKLDGQYEIILRVTKGVEYVKLVLKDGRLQGAVLIGETDLEEMCENLILNQLDLSPYGEDILNPDIDIEDYFD